MFETSIDLTLSKALSVLSELQKEIENCSRPNENNKAVQDKVILLENQIEELKLENEKLKSYSKSLEDRINLLSKGCEKEYKEEEKLNDDISGEVYIVNCEQNECLVADNSKHTQSFKKTPFILKKCSTESCTSKEGLQILSTPSTLNVVRLSWAHGKKPSRVLIITKKGNMEATLKLASIIQWLYEQGVTSYVEPHVIEELKEVGLTNVYTWDESDRYSLHTFIDFVITLGGDGTLLFASTLFHECMPPVISFNMGTLGFLTSFSASYFRSPLTKVLAGDIPLMIRVRFEYVIVRNIQDNLLSDALEYFSTQESRKSMKILNDIVIDRGTSSSMVELHCYIDSNYITTVHADGLIIATPTGSTAYSMSAGGSMVHPLTPGMLMTPICPHTLSFRQMVFPDNTILRIEVSPNSRCPASVSFDGQFKETLNQGDAIIIRTSKYPVPSISHEDTSNHWFRNVRDGLHWNIATSPLFARKESVSFVVCSPMYIPILRIQFCSILLFVVIRMGFLSIPKVNHCAGLILLIINCILPGIGTIIGGFINSGGCDCCIAFCGLIQLLTAPFIIGWVWSIIWGCRMFT